MKTSRASATAASATNHMRAVIEPQSSGPGGRVNHRGAARAVRYRLLAPAAAGALLMAGCEALAPKPAPPPVTGTAPPPAAEALPAPEVEPGPPAVEPAPPRAAIDPSALRPADWKDLPGWRADDPAAAWGAFRASCRSPGMPAAFRESCAAAHAMPAPDRETARRFFETRLKPYRVVSGDGAGEGLLTGYYEPLLRGSRRASERYRFPVLAVPEDLLVVDLAELHPELKGLALRGRLDGRRVVPYLDRAGIEQGRAGAGREIAWVDDPVELFFLQIQGSGRIALDSGETIRVGFGDHNGYPYRSIGRLLVERGELAPSEASMQGIKAWARANPGKLTELLNQNARYVFFRELTATGAGPPGALGVPLTPRRSIAVDPRFVPLGAPVFIATTWPLTNRPMNQLVLAQDTGSAIRGAVRADYFWGYGEEAAREAGRMKQRLRMWVLLPKNFQSR
ncbi:MAG: murein transglycosylase A [Burkholderiales bacterium]|nr:murein transglycosylase A [Burkholderiales bacterium]